MDETMGGCFEHREDPYGGCLAVYTCPAIATPLS